MTEYCPACGSVCIIKAKATAKCNNCGHLGRLADFRSPAVTRQHPANIRPPRPKRGTLYLNEEMED